MKEKPKSICSFKLSSSHSHLKQNIKILGKGSFEKKIKSLEFSKQGGGVRTNFPHFLNFFIFIFSCLNSCKSAENFFFFFSNEPFPKSTTNNITLQQT